MPTGFYFEVQALNCAQCTEQAGRSLKPNSAWHAISAGSQLWPYPSQQGQEKLDHNTLQEQVKPWASFWAMEALGSGNSAPLWHPLVSPRPNGGILGVTPSLGCNLQMAPVIVNGPKSSLNGQFPLSWEVHCKSSPPFLKHHTIQYNTLVERLFSCWNSLNEM